MQRWNIRCGIWIWTELFCLWKMQEIHQGQCEECKPRQGVVFCNLFITFNVKYDYVNHRTQMCEYFKSLNYMSAWKLYMVLYSFYLCSPWSPLLSITPEACAMSCLLLEVTCLRQEIKYNKIEVGHLSYVLGCILCGDWHNMCCL